MVVSCIRCVKSDISGVIDFWLPRATTYDPVYHRLRCGNSVRRVRNTHLKSSIDIQCSDTHWQKIPASVNRERTSRYISLVYKIQLSALQGWVASAVIRHTFFEL